jgi:SAM-dependent methyltransferase
MEGSPVSYDEIASDYSDSKQLPFRRHLEEPTLFRLLGGLRGKSVLDLACGDGIYTRKMKLLGAGPVVGVDLSPRMVELARRREAEAPLDITYLVHDAGNLEHLGDFDVVVGSYLLNYARTEAELLAFCRAIHRNLKPGGRFVGMNDNPWTAAFPFPNYRAYGFTKAASEPIREGCAIHYTFYKPDGTSFEFDNFHWNPSTYARIFRLVGFAHFEWRNPWLSDEARAMTHDDEWRLFLASPPVIGVEAIKDVRPFKVAR